MEESPAPITQCVQSSDCFGLVKTMQYSVSSPAIENFGLLQKTALNICGLASLPGAIAQ
jgi:hypothetical protein